MLDEYIDSNNDIFPYFINKTIIDTTDETELKHKLIKEIADSIFTACREHITKSNGLLKISFENIEETVMNYATELYNILCNNLSEEVNDNIIMVNKISVYLLCGIICHMYINNTNIAYLLNCLEVPDVRKMQAVYNEIQYTVDSRFINIFNINDVDNIKSVLDQNVFSDEYYLFSDIYEELYDINDVYYDDIYNSIYDDSDDNVYIKIYDDVYAKYIDNNYICTYRYIYKYILNELMIILNNYLNKLSYSTDSTTFRVYNDLSIKLCELSNRFNDNNACEYRREIICTAIEHIENEINSLYSEAVITDDVFKNVYWNRVYEIFENTYVLSKIYDISMNIVKNTSDKYDIDKAAKDISNYRYYDILINDINDYILNEYAYDEWL